MRLYTSPVTSCLMTPTVTDVFLLERLVPDRGVVVKRAAEGDVERHRVVDLVCERVDLGVGAASRWGVKANKKVPLGSKAAQTGGFGRLAVRLFQKFTFSWDLDTKCLQNSQK